MTRVDVLVLGTGPAGSSVAKRCAEAGRRVVVVEAREVGGTCALRGCNPKKVLVASAALVDAVRRARGRLLGRAEVDVEWASLVAFERTFTDPVPDRARREFDEAGAEVVVGRPRFVDASTVAVGERTIEAEHVVIATGARPRTLDVEGAEHVVTSDAFLTLDVLPERVLFVGGGYISFEFAHVAARVGARPTIWEHGARPLPAFDADLVDALVAHTRDLGVDVDFERSAARVTPRDGQFVVADAHGREETFDLVVHGAGRVPNLDGLDLDAAGIAHDDDGVTVDRHLRSTSAPHVFALGDCAASGHARLTPAANAHAHAVARAKLVVERDGGRLRGAHLLGPDAHEVVNLFVLAVRAGLTTRDLKSAPLAFPTSGHDVRSMV